MPCFVQLSRIFINDFDLLQYESSHGKIKRAGFPTESLRRKLRSCSRNIFIYSSWEKLFLSLSVTKQKSDGHFKCPSYLEGAVTFDTGLNASSLPKKEMSLNANCVQTQSGGRGWIRTTEVTDNRFTVCPLWPLGNSPIFNFYQV